MTQAAGIPRERYDGNDVATSFPFNHYIKTDDELVLTHKTSAGVVTLPILDTDYTMTGEGTSSVTITFPKGGSSYGTLASGTPDERLTALRVTDEDRTVDVLGAYFFGTLNDGEDKTTRLIQELFEIVGRCAQQTVSNDDTVPTLEEILALTDLGNLSDLDGTTPVGTDIGLLERAGVKMKFLFSALATYLNTGNAIHDNVAAEISALDAVTLADGDSFLVEDLNAGTANSKLKCLASAIWTYILSKIAAAGLTLGGTLDMNSNDIDNAKTVTFIALPNNTGATPTIDWGAAQKQTITLAANATPIDPFTAPAGPCNLMLKVVQAGTGSYTITWPAAVRWPAGIAPTLSTAVGSEDWISFVYDGTNYDGQAGLDFQ